MYFDKLQHGINFAHANIGKTEKITISPYFCAFLIKNLLLEWQSTPNASVISWGIVLSRLFYFKIYAVKILQNKFTRNAVTMEAIALYIFLLFFFFISAIYFLSPDEK